MESIMENGDVKLFHSKPLTEVELEMMNILWKLGRGNVNQILEALSEDRKLAYTSVSTIVRILEQKGYVKPIKDGRGHIYEPLIAKEIYEEMSIKHLVNHVFEGAPSSMIKRLIDTKSLSKEELRELKQLLNEKGI